MTTVLDKFNREKHYFSSPYPHIIIENALPQELYNELSKTFPNSEIKKQLPVIQGHTYRYLANNVLYKKTIPVSEKWQRFFEDHTSQNFYDMVLDIFDSDIPYTKQDIQQKVAVRGFAGKKYDMVTDTQFVVHQPTKGTTRTTHIDNPQELYAGLLYFKQDNDKSTGGDFEIYETGDVKQVWKLKGREIPEEQHKSLVKTITYQPNTLVMFLNTSKSVHGVTPRINADVDRLSINIIAETNDKRNEFFKLFNTGLR